MAACQRNSVYLSQCRTASFCLGLALVQTRRRPLRSPGLGRVIRRKLDGAMRDRGVAVAIAGLTLLFAVPVLLAQAPKQKPGLEPAPVQSSALTVKLEPAGAIPVHTNPTSPIA